MDKKYIFLSLREVLFLFHKFSHSIFVHILQYFLFYAK